MKHFRVNNNSWQGYQERYAMHAIDVVRIINARKWDTYEVEWKNPVTGGYITLIKVKNGKRVYTNDFFNIPKTFNKLGKIA